MTFRERLAKEHPECISEDFVGGCENCPYDYGYERRNYARCLGIKACGDAACRACWDREIPMTPEEQAALPPLDDEAPTAPHEVPQAVRELVEARIHQLTGQIKALEDERDMLCDWLNER